MSRSRPKFVRLLVVAALATCVAATASAGKRLVNVDRKGVGIHGYDPVAYFTVSKATKGKTDLVSEYEGVKYRFASDENKKLFDAEPAKYVPQYGGYCGYAVANNDTADIDPEAFVIQDGRLILQYSKSILAKWQGDPKAYLSKADANWPKLVESKGK